MDDLNNKAIFAQKVFCQIMADTEKRLQRGAERRRRMQEKLERGEQPDCPRSQWLRSTSRRLIEEITQAAQEFNETNTDDLISVSDLADVLTTTLALLKRTSEEG